MLVSVAPHATLLAFTDGLVERRGEPLTDSLERLRKAAAPGAPSVDDLLERVVTDLTRGSPEDDVAMIGLRWLT